MDEGRNKTALVVDDAPEARDVTRHMLERIGFEVLTARDGLDAAEAYCGYEGQIDVILLDLMMPELDGVETVRVIRAVSEEVKVILVTGSPDQLVTDRWRELGFSGFLLKPFSSAQLREALEEALGD